MSLPTLRRFSSRGIGVNTVAVAAFVHITLLIALLLPRAPVPEPDGVAIELVESEGPAPMPMAATTPAQEASVDPPASPPPPETAAPTPDPPTPDTPTPDPPTPAPPPPEPAETVPPQPEPTLVSEPVPEPEPIRRTYAATANTIIRDEESSVTTTGEASLPPQLAGYRNQPPRYPAEAERRRLEGEVRVLIRVRTDGVPAAVELVGSSGSPMLDRAAIDTLLTWRFAPTRVAAAFPFNIRFVLGQR